MMSDQKDGKQLVIIGDNCMNIVLLISKDLTRGGNFDVRRSIRRPGGNALVTSLLLARWNAPVTYIGVIGDDPRGNELRTWSRTVSLDTTAMVLRGRTRVSYAIVDEGERTILDERPEASQGELSRQDLEAMPSLKQQISKADIIMLDRYCSGIHEDVSMLVRKRKEAGERPILVYRTGSRHSAGLEIESRLLPQVDICFTKAGFLDGLGFSGEIIAACKKLSQLFNIPLVVATAGERGAGYFDRCNGDAGLLPPNILAPAVNTLGGGDFFRAGFLFGFSQGKTILEAVRWGNTVAGIHCSRPETDDIFSLFFPILEVERLLNEGN
jgi:sugar/nucleoside kinase (ribokinase family)